MAKSLIEWTESTWNPITGCTKISEGCANCYAERLAKRLKAMGQKKYINEFRLTLHPDALDEPLHLKKPQVIFVCSMSDIFHKDVPDDFIIRIFEVMNKAPQHVFQVLTKRADRLDSIADKVKWTSNIWMGVTVENDDAVWRVKHLQRVPAAVRFLSVEPMIGPIDSLPLDNIEWVIVGGESGYGSRIMKKEWVESIQKQCEINRVPFFFKQWGGVNKKKAGRLLDGREYNEMPEYKGDDRLFA